MFQSCWIDVLRVFTLWYELYLKRPDSSYTTFRGTNQPKLSMFRYKWNPMKLKRVEVSSDTSESPESSCNLWSFGQDFVLKPLLVRYNIVVAIVDAWKSDNVFTTWSTEVEFSYHGCLKHWSHYLKLSWTVMPMSTCLKSNQAADVSQDFSQWVSQAWPKNCCRGLDHEPWHDLCFCLIVWCSLDFILRGLFTLKFHKTFESHLRAVTMLALIDGSSQSQHHQADESVLGISAFCNTLRCLTSHSATPRDAMTAILSNL